MSLTFFLLVATFLIITFSPIAMRGALVGLAPQTKLQTPQN